ncbi:hypothetical protein [Deinococcus roseus]|uniref:hypothetical protein n=1 Tax=Deinococcus roseus TaxID=392414 RepID=UPI001662FB51|nr:hypothetical protein [Deinococcus roseus]
MELNLEFRRQVRTAALVAAIVFSNACGAVFTSVSVLFLVGVWNSLKHDLDGLGVIGPWFVVMLISGITLLVAGKQLNAWTVPSMRMLTWVGLEALLWGAIALLMRQGPDFPLVGNSAMFTVCSIAVVTGLFTLAMGKMRQQTGDAQGWVDVTHPLYAAMQKWEVHSSGMEFWQRLGVCYAIPVMFLVLCWVWITVR